MTACELAFYYVHILRALSTVDQQRRHYWEYFDRTGKDIARRGLRRQQKRILKILEAVQFIEKALGRVDVPTKKWQVAKVWPPFVDMLTGRLKGSWRSGSPIDVGRKEHKRCRSPKCCSNASSR